MTGAVGSASGALQDGQHTCSEVKLPTSMRWRRRGRLHPGVEHSCPPISVEQVMISNGGRRGTSAGAWTGARRASSLKLARAPDMRRWCQRVATIAVVVSSTGSPALVCHLYGVLLVCFRMPITKPQGHLDVTPSCPLLSSRLRSFRLVRRCCHRISHKSSVARRRTVGVL